MIPKIVAPSNNLLGFVPDLRRSAAASVNTPTSAAIVSTSPARERAIASVAIKIIRTKKATVGTTILAGLRFKSVHDPALWAMSAAQAAVNSRTAYKNAAKLFLFAKKPTASVLL